jgi:hypothetical protein
MRGLVDELPLVRGHDKEVLPEMRLADRELPGPEPDSYGPAMGSLDDDPGVRPLRHEFVGSKAPWYDITDSLPQYREFPDC